MITAQGMRVLFAIHAGDSLAHVYRTRRTASRLHARGFVVRYVLPSRVMHLLDGFLPRAVLRPSDQSYSFARYSVLPDREAQVVRHARSEWRVYVDFAPHLVIGDTGLMSHAYRPEVPFLKILSRFYFETGGEGVSPYSREQLDVLVQQVEDMVNIAAEGLGLPRTFRYRDLIDDDALLCADESMSRDLPHRPWMAAGFQEMAISPDSRRSPYIGYVNLGTGLAEHQTALASRVLEQAADMFDRFYVSAGYGGGSESLAAPRNASIQPGYTSIPEDAGVIVSHGGIASVQLAIRLGLPLVLAPLQVEQYSNAWHAERLGYGINCGVLPAGPWRGLETRLDYSPERFALGVEAARRGGGASFAGPATTRRPLGDVVEDWIATHQ